MEESIQGNGDERLAKDGERGGRWKSRFSVIFCGLNLTGGASPEKAKADSGWWKQIATGCLFYLQFPTLPVLLLPLD